MMSIVARCIVSGLLVLLATTSSAGTSQGTVAWDITGLEDNAGQLVVGVVLDYRFDTEMESIPVNGYLVLEVPNVGTLPVPEHGTVLVNNSGEMVMYLNDLFNSYSIAIGADLNGLMVMYDSSGAQVDSGALAYKPVFQSILSGRLF